MMYIKATVKQITANSNSDPNLQVELEGVEKFILKCEDYKDEIQLVKRKLEDKNKEIDDNDKKLVINLKDKNIFIGYDETFYLKDADKKFSVPNGLQDLIKNIFISGTTCIFEVDYKDTKDKKGTNGAIISVRKCD